MLQTSLIRRRPVGPLERETRMAMNALQDLKTIRRMAAEESVGHLKLLKSHAVTIVDSLLENAVHEHPKAICADYRRRGNQISDQEKKALKIRKNAFMNQQALAEISDTGLQDPIRAHELTVLRATFVISRYRTALSAERMILEYAHYPIEVQYDVFHPDACAVCNSLYRKPVPSDWALFPPKGCTCVTAPYGLHLNVDYIGGYLEEEKLEKTSSSVSIVEKIKEYFR